ncbi:MAG TPA: peptide chain release factor 1 [Oscillospiraceae bacterium]|nr:peptide chain release factor 1 [Oscillospiraceae bacterium]
MFEKLTATRDRYDEIAQKLIDPEVCADIATYTKLMKEYKDLTPLMTQYSAFLKAEQEIADAEEMMSGADPDFKAILSEEIEAQKELREKAAEELKILLLPRDPNDDKNVIVEIRGGAGGEEASLFANSLYRMYTMYAESKRFKAEVLSLNETELGGIKEISFNISGDGAYSRFKFESGVHRVQRVPETEAGGRIHTSTVTVAVLPEAEDIEVEINPDDLQIDTYRSGAGGQHVNKTESAIRITHIPTGTIVECQDERSQFKNKERAMKILRSRIYEQQQQKQTAEIAAERRSQVGSGDRSERIRTYNFPQGRVTDHRIGLTLYKIDAIMNGDLDELIDALITADRAAKLGEGETE